MNFVAYLLAWALPTKTVDKAVRAISKAAATLAAAEDIQVKRASSLGTQIVDLEAERAEALETAARARRIADRLAALTA